MNTPQPRESPAFRRGEEVKPVKAGTLPVVTIVWPDGDHVSIQVDGQEVAAANHDEHGRAGMEAVVNTARGIAEAAGLTINTEGVPNA